jgi:hypothetical protein
MEGKLLPQFRIVLPLDTTPREAEAHARARLAGPLAEQFEIATIGLLKIGEIKTKGGRVFGKQFLVVLRPINPSDESVDEDDGPQVLYEHPDYKNLVKH